LAGVNGPWLGQKLGILVLDRTSGKSAVIATEQKFAKKENAILDE